MVPGESYGPWTPTIASNRYNAYLNFQRRRGLAGTLGVEFDDNNGVFVRFLWGSVGGIEVKEQPARS